MSVDPMTFWAVVSAGGAAVSTLATIVYSNRKQMNQLNQRLFGMDGDDTDDGAMQNIDNKIDNLAQELEERHEEVYAVVEEIRDEQRRED